MHSRLKYERRFNYKAKNRTKHVLTNTMEIGIHPRGWRDDGSAGKRACSANTRTWAWSSITYVKIQAWLTCPYLQKYGTEIGRFQELPRQPDKLKWWASGSVPYLREIWQRETEDNSPCPGLPLWKRSLPSFLPKGPIQSSVLSVSRFFFIVYLLKYLTDVFIIKEFLWLFSIKTDTDQQNRMGDSEIKPYSYDHLILDNYTKYMWLKNTSPTDGAGKARSLSLSLTLCKNQLQMGQRSSCKSKK